MTDAGNEQVVSFVRSERDDGCAKVESYCSGCGEKLTAYTVELLDKKERGHKCRVTPANTVSTGL